MKYFIGIDIGTSSTKAVLFDELGTSLLSASSEYNIISPKLGYIEENPNDWLKATIITIKEITKTYPVIEGIGLSGQMHGLVLLDKNDKILRNSIIWCDNRTGKEKEEIDIKSLRILKYSIFHGKSGLFQKTTYCVLKIIMLRCS